MGAFFECTFKISEKGFGGNPSVLNKVKEKK